MYQDSRHKKIWLTYFNRQLNINVEEKILERRNFAQVLKDDKVDIKLEYKRLYEMFNSN